MTTRTKSSPSTARIATTRRSTPSPGTRPSKPSTAPSVRKASAPSPSVTTPSFYDPRRDGITQGLLAQFLFCRERARIGLQGWTERAGSLGQSYGNIMHAVCEGMYRDVQTKTIGGIPGPMYLHHLLLDIEAMWRKDNPLADANDLQLLEQGLMLTAAVLPGYVRRYPEDFTKTAWHSLEHQFRVMRDVPGIGLIPLRGKMDGVHLRKGYPRLLETKTRGVINEADIAQVLPLDLQVGFYLSALRTMFKRHALGVDYNVIRRPQLRQKTGESFDAFAKRCEEDVRLRPDFYFLRMEMDVDPADIDRFDLQLDDLITDFVHWWEGKIGHYRNSSHCAPSVGRNCSALPICANRDFTTFFRRPTVFRELEEM